MTCTSSDRRLRPARLFLPPRRSLPRCGEFLRTAPTPRARCCRPPWISPSAIRRRCSRGAPRRSLLRLSPRGPRRVSPCVRLAQPRSLLRRPRPSGRASRRARTPPVIRRRSRRVPPPPSTRPWWLRIPRLSPPALLPPPVAAPARLAATRPVRVSPSPQRPATRPLRVSPPPQRPALRPVRVSPPPQHPALRPVRARADIRSLSIGARLAHHRRARRSPPLPRRPRGLAASAVVTWSSRPCLSCWFSSSHGVASSCGTPTRTSVA